MPVSLTCDNCGKEYKRPPSAANTGKHAFCSHRCYLEKIRWVNGQKGKEVPCDWCGTMVYRTPGRLRRSKYNYCSMECLGSARADTKGTRYRGERRKLASGYIALHASKVPLEYGSMIRDRSPSGRGGSILEHRLIMAMHLGRPLEEWEVVHHKNGVKDDNSIENLELHGDHVHAGISVVEHKRIAELRRENRKLKAENAALQARIAELEAMLDRKE